MGQYLKGSKIGTCESMYYMTLVEARECAGKGMSDDDGIKFSEYLSDNETRFRFAWPEEDAQTFFIHSGERQPFKSFSIPCGDLKINHDAVVIHNTHKGGGHGINIWIPCPHAEDFNLKTSSGGAGEQFVEIMFQAVRQGAEKTIFACSRCGQQQRFSDEDVEKIRLRAREYYGVYEKSDPDHYAYAMKVIERIK